MPFWMVIYGAGGKVLYIVLPLHHLKSFRESAAGGWRGNEKV